MKIPPADVVFIAQRFGELAQAVDDAWEETAASRAGEDDGAPGLLIDAMQRLATLLRQFDEASEGLSDEAVDPAEHELHALGEFGIHILDDMADLASAVNLPDTADELHLLALPLAVWLARNGAEITYLAPVVNAVARLAHHKAEPQDMAELYTCICLVIDAVDPRLVGTEADYDPQNPWRLLILNRAIVATRSHRPELMEPALDAVVELLPEDAARFFAEGMEQMDKIPYPDKVREIMRRYYLDNSTQRVLH